MKRLLLLFLCFSTLHAKPITVGDDMAAAEATLKAAGSSEVGIARIAPHPRQALTFLSINQGTLIFRYDRETGVILGMTFYLADERPKALRKAFEFRVESYDPETGRLVLLTQPEYTRYFKGEDFSSSNMEAFALGETMMVDRLVLDDVAFSQALEEISDQSLDLERRVGMSIVYLNPNEADRKISLDVSNQKLFAVLDEACEKADHYWTMSNSCLLVVKDPTSVQQGDRANADPDEPFAPPSP